MGRSRAITVALVSLFASLIVEPAAAATERSPSPARADAGTTDLPFMATMTEPIAGGVTRRHGRWATTDGQQVVELIDVDPAGAGISLETSSPAGGVDGLETVRSQALRQSRDGHRVITAINGDVWGTSLTSDTRAPIGLQVHRGELVTGSTRVLPTLGLDATEAPRLGDVAINATVSLPDGGAILTIDRVNKPRRNGDLVLYSQRWGSSTRTLAGGTEVVLTGASLPLRPRGTWTATVASVLPSGANTPIADGSLVLSGQGVDAVSLATMAPGAAVTISIAVSEGWQDVVEAIGGREWLAEAGVVSVRPVDTWTGVAHPRTAVGVTPNGHVVLATIDGRQPGYSIGVVASDLAELLLAQGASDAILLDGGGSTTAVVRRPGDVEATLVNRPSDGVERPVASALLVVSSIPTGPLARLVVRPEAATAGVGETWSLAAKGVDAAMNGVALPAGPVAWSMTGTVGTLTTTGAFRATQPGVASVGASTAGLVGSATISVKADTFAPIASPPQVRLRTGGRADGRSLPVTVSWATASDIGTGVARYQLRRRVGSGSWVGIALPTALTRSIALRVPTGSDVTYQVRAIDRAGNAGWWKTAGTIRARIASDRSTAIRYTGPWRTGTSSSYLGGTDHFSRSRGATATFMFTGSQLAWISPRGASRGSARVWVDGTAVTVVKLYRSSYLARRLVFTRAFGSTGAHRVTIQVLGTSGHPRVDVDGFAVVEARSVSPSVAPSSGVTSVAGAKAAPISDYVYE